MTTTWKIPSRVALLCAASLLSPLTGTAATELATAPVQGGASQRADLQSFDGVVEPVRQATLAAQVAGSIVSLSVKVGDTVRAGQELARIDARAASQNTAATVAQVEAARATLNVSSKEYERQKQLFQKQYISQSALDRAQAQFQASQAQMQALQAQSDAAHTQSRFFVINAPYAGIVSDVPVALGDMAMPGAPLLTLYDPAALRVSAPVPPGTVTSGPAEAIQLEIPGLAPALLAPTSATLLPQVDAATHTAQLRLALPDNLKGATPGMFARVWLAASGVGKTTTDSERLYVSTSAVVRRAEMTGLYIVNDKGRPMLRQVRLGRAAGERVEVLSGVEKGEKVAADPQAAAKVR